MRLSLTLMPGPATLTGGVLVFSGQAVYVFGLGASTHYTTKDLA